MAQSLGIKPITVAPSLTVDDGINAVRALIPRCYFDKKKCAQGIEALRNYRKEYDEKRKEYKNKPYHDWTSHGSDAFRYFAVGHRQQSEVKSVVSFMQKMRFKGTW